MPRSPANKWSLKRIIKKASDVNFNTAVALSKSLKELEKQNKKRSKELSKTPFHLMKNPLEVNKTLDERLSHSILQFSKINSTNIVPTHCCKVWDKTSLYSDTKPGDLSYDNINLTELMEYYVSDLMPFVCPSTYREGDKMLSMSKIVGRERSFLSQNNMELNDDQSINENVNNDNLKTIDHENSSKLPTNELINDILSLPSNSLHDTESNDDSKSGRFMKMCDEELLKENSSKLPTNELINDILSLSSNSLHDTESNDDSKSGRFMKMFNNCKFSDFVVLLKSKDILYLHKFVLSAWMCDEELLKHSEHFILDIEDDVVLKFFKHLYSDGRFNIDDLIDTEQFSSLCTMFGLKQSLIKRFSAVDIKPCKKVINSLDSENLCNTESKNGSFTKDCSSIISKFPLSQLSFEKDLLINKNEIDQCNSSVEQSSNSNQILSNSTIFSVNNAQSTPNCRNISIKNKDIDQCVFESISDKDLFESVEMDSNDNMDFLINDSVDHIHQNNDKCKKLEINYSLHNKLCSPTNDSYHFNSPDSYSKWLEANPIIDVNLSASLNKNECLKSFNQNHTKISLGNDVETNDKMIKNNFENNYLDLECDNCSPTYFPSKASDQIQEHMKLQNNFVKNDLIKLFDNDIDFNIKIISKNENHDPDNEEILKSNIYSCNQETTPILFSNLDSNNKLENSVSEEMEINNENLDNSVLPLCQRIGLNYPFKNNKEKPIVINLSSDDDNIKDPLSKIQNHKKSKSVKSDKVPTKRKSKNELTKNSVENIPKKSSLKVSRKRKSKESLDLTPIKQKLAVNPFTPMRDFSLLPTPTIKKEISNFGFKESLTKNNSIKILQQVYFLSHQVDTNEDSSSCTTLESLNNSLNESSLNKSSESEDKLIPNDSTELFLFLKKHYLKDILTYKPIDIKKVLTELKDIGINITLKKLNDYFDDQCILCSNDDNNGKNKKYNRPLKASKMIL